MTNQYPEHILKKLRQRQDLEPSDKSMDEKLNKYSPNEAFADVLEWEGFLGWDGKIKGWIESIYGIDLNKVNEMVYNEKMKRPKEG